MSHRPIQQKQLNRLRKQVSRTSLPAHIDLTMWLMDRGHAQTSGQARQLLMDGRVTANGRPVGRFIPNNKKGDWAAAPVVPAELREELRFEQR